jgi:hypothetical protein
MVVGQGLLTGDVLARLEGGHDLVGVKPGGGEQLHGVDRVVVEHLGEVRVDARGDAPSSCSALRALGGGIAQGRHLAAGVLQIAGDVELGDVAAAGDGQTQPVGGTGHAAILPRRRQGRQAGPAAG